MSDTPISGALPDARLDALSDAKRALLARRLAERAAAGRAAAGIPRRADPSRAPLSAAQEEAWLLEARSEQLTAYNLANAWRVRGPLDEGALQRALDELVRRHESLRTTFVLGAAGPEQRIGTPRAVELEVTQAQGSMEERDVYAAVTLGQWARRTFDLASDLLLRAGIVRLASDDRVLFLMVHHLAADAVSRGVLLAELAALYDAERHGRDAALSPVEVQYADYAAWERGDAHETRLAAALARWRDRLADAPEALDLPTDRMRGNAAAHAGGTRAITLPPSVVADVRALAQRHDATPFMVLFAGFAALLGRYAGQEDLVVGVPVAGRARPELARVVGFYTNTIAIRADLTGNPSFAELVGRVRARALDAFDDQEVPFARVTNALRRAGRPTHAPVFQVMFALQNHGAEPLALSGVSLEPLAVSVGGTKFDLTLLASERSEGLRLALEYREDLYDGETATRIVTHLGRLLTAAVAEPETKLSALPLMDDVERAQVLERWNHTAREYPDTTLAALLDEQAARTPDAPAITFDGETLSYAALHARADALAGSLRAAGAGRGALVGVCAERSLELVVALLATVKSGAAYVPLDPDYPVDRLAYMLEDAAPAIVLTTRDLAPRLAGYRGTTLRLDAPDTWPTPVAGRPDIAPADPAYMIYTSGSTGRPKGALNAHRGIVNRLLWMQEQYGLGASDVVLQKTPYSFDVSVWEFFWPLLAGARLTLARPAGHRDPVYLARLIEREGVTVCHFVPSMLGAFLAGLRERGAGGCESLRHVVCSGEALTADLVAGVQAALPGAALHNLYGPTECAVDVTHWTCTDADARAGTNVPIGRPVANTQLYVLDPHGAPLPVGVPGELYLAGTQVGLGYHGRPDLTAERFVVDSFGGDRSARMYRTGDRARWRADGAVEFLGRLDFQVKLRGFRIELGEIEATLATHPAVAQSAVVLRAERGGEIAAYVVPDAERAGAVRRLAALETADTSLARFDLPDGTTVFHRNRGETEFLYREIFEGEGYLRHGLAIGEDDVVFDVGANVGLFTLFAGLAMPRTRVYAFEPIPPLFDVARANAELHAVQGRVFPFGLGSRAETVSFTYYPGNSVLSGRYASAEEESEVVRRYIANDATATATNAPLDELVSHSLRSERYDCAIRRLSDVMRETGVERIDLLKIDVEKAEWDVLQGIDEADWPKIRQAVIEVHDVDGRLAQVLELLRRHGFTCVAEEERMLAGTGLYAVYARRGDAPRAVATDAVCVPVWRGAAALREELRRHLARTLPDYMVPGAIVFLDAMPLTSSGKLDRRALPAPHFAAALDDQPPVGPVEEVVASVWRQSLQVERVGRTTSFFELGGHSLLVTRVVAALATLLRIQLPIRAMFDAPTVAGVAAALVARETTAGQTARVAQLVLKLQAQAARAAAHDSDSPMGTHA